MSVLYAEIVVFWSPGKITTRTSRYARHQDSELSGLYVHGRSDTLRAVDDAQTLTDEEKCLRRVVLDGCR
eukprot:COSAG02_NODE_1270_length_13529_cov_44.209680_10_plen_70_part_00